MKTLNALISIQGCVVGDVAAWFRVVSLIRHRLRERPELVVVKNHKNATASKRGQNSHLQTEVRLVTITMKMENCFQYVWV